MKNIRLKIKKYLLFSSALLLIFLLANFFPIKKQEEKDSQEKTLKMLYQILTNLHYRKIELNEAFSFKVYDKYIEILDPFKIFFTQEDLETLAPYKKTLGEDFKNNNLHFFYKSTSLWKKKVHQTDLLIKEIMLKPFKFTADELFSLEYKNTPFAKNLTELKKRHGRFIKYQMILDIYLNKEKEKKNSKGKELKDKNFSFYEKQARENIRERIINDFSRLKTYSISHWFSLYLNAITAQYDPHTNYLSDKNMEEFNLTLSGQLQGIGAILSYEKGHIIIRELIIGGPAFKSKQLEVGDKIIKVGQSHKKIKDIRGMDLNESIHLIRGKKDTPVYLTIQDKNNLIKEVTLIRDVIEIQETFAKSSILIDAQKNKFGLIHLPEFYFNPSNKKGRNASEDIKKEINALKNHQIKGLIVDLRKNGGGSLELAVDITGFFIGKGPVVQIQNSNGKKTVLYSKQSTPLWDGPLSILVDEDSASASEIFAAAIQDHKKGVIIGDEKTYGKGSVQVIFPFNSFYSLNPNNKESLKFTLSKFYRINGESTQLKGVTPDIILPSSVSYNDTGEKEKENPLPWDAITPIEFFPSKEINIDQIKNKSQLRIRENKNYKLLDELYKSLAEKNQTIPLNWQKFNSFIQKQKKIKDATKFLENYSNKLEVILLDPATSKKWKQEIEKDFFIQEAIYTLYDMIKG